MLPAPDFNKYSLPKKDPYQVDPILVFDDLNPKSTAKPVISVMISTYNRLSQLKRTLESFARQTFADFEILLNDDGSSQAIFEAVDEFSPFVNIQYFRTPRTTWVSCGSAAYQMMLPHARGDIIAYTHPEMIMDQHALEFTHSRLTGTLRGANTYILDANRPIAGELYTDADLGKRGDHYWVSLRPGFFIDYTYREIDLCNWHKSAKNLQRTSNFWSTAGFAGRTNSWHLNTKIYPWWFFGAALRSNPIVNDMPVYVGHASLDIWLMNYRMATGMVDVTSYDMLCYHQPHQTSAIAPEGEQESVKTDIQLKVKK